MKNYGELKGIVILFAFLALVSPGSSKEKTVASTWTPAPLVIDGLDEEWQGETLFAEEAAGVELAFRNDADQLYVLFLIKDRLHLSNLEATGFTVFASAAGKKSRDRGLRFFRRKVTAEELIQEFTDRGEELTEEQKADFRSKPSYILYDCEVVQKKKVSPAGSSPGAGILQPTYKTSARGEATLLEIRIPLSREALAAGIGASPGESFMIGFEWGGLTEEMKARRLARTAAAAESESRADTQSQSHDSSGSRDMRTGASLSGLSRGTPKKYSFWLEVKLAAAGNIMSP